MSGKTLVILAHPNMESSRVNKRWKEELVKYPEEITLHEIYTLYPYGQIDVEAEQKLLDQYEHIVFEFPLYWYSYPPLLKKWFDDVFTHGWAYGSEGNALEGKRFGIAMTIGDKPSNYTHEGGNQCTIDELLTPFKATARHVGAEALPWYAVFGASFQATDAEIDDSARGYVDYIRKYRGQQA